MSRLRLSVVCCLLGLVPAALLGQSVAFVDAQGQPASEYLEVTRAYVRVVDPGANQSSAIAESVTVELTTAVWSDQEFLTLQETGPGSGVFEGSIRLLVSGPNLQGNGYLETGIANGPPIHYDTITASYTDSGGTPRSATASTVGYHVWFLDAEGNVVTSYVPGSRAYVRIEEHTYNYPNTINHLYTELTSSNGDREVIDLVETGLDTSVFEGSLPLELAAATLDDGRLQAAGGGQISADRYGAWFPAPVYAQTDAASIQIVNAAGQPVDEILENDLVHVRVNSPGDNVNPGAVDTLSVLIQSQYAGDQETVTLTETGPNTGFFVGSVPIHYRDPAAFDDGFLGTGGSRTFQPEEITASYGTYSDTAHTVLSRTTFMGLRDQPVTSYSLRSLVRLKIENLVENNPGQIDTLYVTMSSPLNNDVEPIALVETEANSGVFYGSLPSLETAGSSFDGVLSIGAGQTATVQYYGFFGMDQAQVPFTSNYVPVVQNESRETIQDVPVSLFPLANDSDPEGEPLSLTALSSPAKGSVSVIPYDYVTYTPSPGTFGTDTFTYVVEDAQGGEALGTVTVYVDGVPVANDDFASVDEDASVEIPVLANDLDPENYVLPVVITTPPEHGTAQVTQDWTVIYTPAANYNGTDTFMYKIYDNQALAAYATVTVAVNPVNDPPVASGDYWGVSEDEPGILPVLFNDTDLDGDALTIVSVIQPGQGEIQINPDQTLTYTPPLNFTGETTFTYTISDNNGGTASSTEYIYVNPVNDPPVANADAATVPEDGMVNVAVLANDTDVENNVLTVASVTQGSHGSVVINPDKTVKYTPAANYGGSDSFTYTVSDGNGGSATGTVTITVTSVNDAPVANADSATVAEDGSVDISVLANDTDADGDTLSVSSVTQGAHGTVVINPDKTVKYTPAESYNGSDSFTYTASDGNGGSATGTVTITVTPVNDAPVASADSATVAEDGTVNVTVLGNDTDLDGDTLSVASVTQGAHGAVVINPDKTVRYTPAANYNGSDSFTYTISDGNGGTSSAAVAFNVTAVNDAPVSVNDTATVVAGSAVTVSVLANDSDIDGPGLSVTSVAQGAHGAVTINAGQTVSYTAAPYVGTDIFTYTISDGAGGTATATVNVTITAPSRITAGLQARYDFNEGSGTTVSDTSGVGTPLNLTIASPSSVSWVSGGLSVNTATSIGSGGAASKIISAAQASNAITVEAWIQPSSLTLTGPSRILTLAKNSTQRNLVFGQSSNQYQTQLKTSTGTPSLSTPASSLTLNLTHVVYTRASSGAAVYYINGVQVATQSTTGTFATWGTDHKLNLSDSSWRGTYYLMAVYGRALSSTEVQQNYLAGANGN